MAADCWQKLSNKTNIYKCIFNTFSLYVHIHVHFNPFLPRHPAISDFLITFPVALPSRYVYELFPNEICEWVLFDELANENSNSHRRSPQIPYALDVLISLHQFCLVKSSKVEVLTKIKYFWTHTSHTLKQNSIRLCIFVLFDWNLLEHTTIFGLI